MKNDNRYGLYKPGDLIRFIGTEKDIVSGELISLYGSVGMILCKNDLFLNAYDILIKNDNIITVHINWFERFMEIC